MRHFRSILYALVLAPAVWVLAGVGFTHDLTARGRDDFAVESVTGLLLLVLAGAAYAILLLAPISPAGPLLAGLTLGGISTWALVSPGGYAGAWPDFLTKDSFDVSRPGYGLAALLALPLVCTALSARRWAGYEPPVLPLIGQVGRARGRAVVGGGPVAGAPMARYDDPDATAPMRLAAIAPVSDDTTTVVAAAGPSGSASPPVSPVAAAAPLTAEPATVAEPITAAPVAEPVSAAASSVAEPVTGSPAGEPVSAAASGTTAADVALVAGSAAETAPIVEGAVAALVAEEPFKIGEVVDLEPEDEPTYALRTVRDERQTTVVVSWDEAATVAALSNGQASTKYGTVAPPPAEPEINLLVIPDAAASTASEQAPETTGSPADADTISSPEAEPGLQVADAGSEGTDGEPAGVEPETEDDRQSVDAEVEGTAGVKAAGPEAEPTADFPAVAAQPEVATDTDRGDRPQKADAADESEEPEAEAPEDDGSEDNGSEDAEEDYVVDESVETYVVGRAKAVPHTRAVPPDLEETRSLEAPDPDRTRAINLRELTTKLQVTPAAGAEPTNEPVRARASVAAPDTTGPDLSGAEVTRSLTAPDPDRTQTIKVVTWDAAAAAQAAEAEPAATDDGEVTRSLSAPDPDRTQTIKVVTSDDAGIVFSRGPAAPAEAVDDAEVTRSLSAPDPDRTQAITLAAADDGEVTRSLDAPDPDHTHLIRVGELAPPMRLLASEPATELTGHPGHAPGHNTAAMSHTGDIGGDETQVIELDPDRTQYIRPGTVEPPGERTEIIRLPVNGRAAVAEPVAVSITDDPTSGITQPADGDGERRGMTVLSMERNAEDGPHIPTQRGAD